MCHFLSQPTGHPCFCRCKADFAHAQVPRLWGNLSLELNEDVLTRNGRHDFFQGGAAKLVQWVVDRQRGLLNMLLLLLLLLLHTRQMVARCRGVSDRGC